MFGMICGGGSYEPVSAAWAAAEAVPRIYYTDSRIFIIVTSRLGVVAPPQPSKDSMLVA